MLTVTMLGSGSRGNAILVQNREGAILVDAGFGRRTLERRLADAQASPAKVQALVLTHEHVDHSCGAAPACARWQWPLYASRGTLAAMSHELQEYAEPPISTGMAHGLSVSGITVQCTPVPHDATESVAVVLTDEKSGHRVGIATDLGRIPESLHASFACLDVLVIESNHDPVMLAEGPYPRMLKQRIASSRGHLSNHAAATFAAACVHRGLRGVVLAHLSETNNTPEIATSCMRNALRNAGWQRDAVWAAEQQEVSGPFTGVGPTLSRPAVQLQLF